MHLDSWINNLILIITMTKTNFWNDKNDRFVLYLDIMGFKERVNRCETDALKKDLMSFKTKNNKLKPLLKSKAKDGENDLLKMAQFSDSIVVISRSNTKEDLNRICKATVILMQTAMESKFALRGAIALGQMVFDESNQLFFGKALVDAYLLEEQLAYYGVVFHESAEEKVKEAMSSEGIYYPIKDDEVPIKGGKSKHFHVAWHLMTKALSKGNISTDALTWLENLRTTVSGTPRVYLDNTRKVIEASGLAAE